MSGNFHDANYNVTKIRTEDGNIAELEINGKAVDLTGGNMLDNNKEVTINVSEYTEPVEIEPTSGKNGMKKATVTLTDFPSSVKLYAWKVTITGRDAFYVYTDFPATDQPYTMGIDSHFLNVFDSSTLFAASSDARVQVATFRGYKPGYTVVQVTISSETQFQLKYSGGSGTPSTATYTFTRDSSKDFRVWS